MASINLKELSNPSDFIKKGYTFKDIHLDLNQFERFISNTASVRSIKGKDLQDSIDEAAISNSIFNILNTRPGQRFLLPQFGCNLLGFVGQPITDRMGTKIGETIYDAIRLWEPRVTVDKVFVNGKIDQHEYDITIYVTIPRLKQTDIKLIGTLTSSGILERKLGD
jgi:phage baseplate assembly protein W